MFESAPTLAESVRDVERRIQKAEQQIGLELPAETEVRVWDATAEIRYLVLPLRPKGTEGMSEKDLAALVTRDSMIGVGPARCEQRQVL